MPEDGQLLNGLSGGGGLLGVTKSLTSVTSVASTLVETVKQTVTHLNAVTSQVTQLAGNLSNLTSTAADLPATVTQFTNTIASAFTTVTQVASEASNVLGQGTELTEAITKVQTSTQVLVKQITSSTVDVTIVQKSVTTVVTSIQYYISVTQGYIGVASNLLNSPSILPMATAVGKILVSMQSVLEIVSSTITTVQTVTRTTSTTTIIKTTLERVRGLVQNFTNQISDPSVIPSLLKKLPGYIGGISSAFPAESPTGPGDAKAGTPNEIPNDIVTGSNIGANGQDYPSNSRRPNLPPIIPQQTQEQGELGNKPLIPTPNQGYTNNLNNLKNEQYIPYPDNDQPQHSFWNYPVRLTQPSRVGPQYKSTNFGNQGPSQAGFWDGPTEGQQVNTIDVPYRPIEQVLIGPISQGDNLEAPITENDQTYRGPQYQSANNGNPGPQQGGYWKGPTEGQQVNAIDGTNEIVIGPINQDDNLETPITKNDQTFRAPNSYPDDYSQSPELPPSQQIFTNLATPPKNGPISQNYQFPSQTSENYPSISQSPYLVPEYSGTSVPEPSSISPSYPNYSADDPPTSSPIHSTPFSENYPFTSQTSGNYPSIGSFLYPDPEISDERYPIHSSWSYLNYPIIAPSLPSTSSLSPAYALPIDPGSTPVSSATSSASASLGHATASAAVTTSTLGAIPSFSVPSNSISIFLKYEIALHDIYAKILQIISSVQGLPTDQLTFAVRRSYATTHTLILFISQLNVPSATSPSSGDIIFNIINELSGNIQDLVRLAQQIFAIQGDSTPLLTILKLTSAATAFTINQVQKLAQQINTSAGYFVLQSSIDTVLLSLINIYGQLYPGAYAGKIDQPNGVDDLFNNLSTSNQSYDTIYYGISHSDILVIKNIIQQAAQTIKNSDNDYNRLLNTLQALPLNQDQIKQITNLMYQMNNNLNTVSYRLQSIEHILNYISDCGHIVNFGQYSTVSQSSSSSNASSTSSPDRTETSAASASSSSTTITARYSQVV